MRHVFIAVIAMVLLYVLGSFVAPWILKYLANTIVEGSEITDVHPGTTKWVLRNPLQPTLFRMKVGLALSSSFLGALGMLTAYGRGRLKGIPLKFSLLFLCVAALGTGTGLMIQVALLHGALTLGSPLKNLSPGRELVLDLGPILETGDSLMYTGILAMVMVSLAVSTLLIIRPSVSRGEMGT